MQKVCNEAGFVSIDAKDYVVPKYVETRGYLYVMVDSSEPDLIKVGRTVDIPKRLAGYNADRPRNPVFLFAVTDCFADVLYVESKVLESLKVIHQILPESGSKEWFSKGYTDEILTAFENAEAKFETIPKEDKCVQN